jgi:hypothetical protein
MTSPYKAVSEDIWTISDEVTPNIRAEILEAVEPRWLIECTAKKAEEASTAQSKERCVAFYEEYTKDKSHKRSCVFIAIDDPKLFNQLFNGRCGYRAMYYQCPDLGRYYNQLLSSSIAKVLNKEDTSLSAITTKVWPFYELTYIKNGLLIERWKNKMGANIFCPQRPAMIIKGGFISENGHEEDFKPHRSQQIHNEGFS